MNDLLAQFPQLKEDDIRSTSMGAGGEDIQLSTTARRVLPYTFEAKNQERVSIWTAIDQARKNNPSSEHTPIIVFKKNGELPCVAFPWAHFLQLIKRDKEASKTVKQTTKETLLHIADQLHAIASRLDDDMPST